MKNQHQKGKHLNSQKESEDLINLDKELKDLISKNETLNIGIKKIFKEINKKDNNN